MSDVFIIGAGPAGLAAAIEARRRGLSVTIADGHQPPIDKPCGEGLMPDSRHHAEQLGIRIPAGQGYEFQGIRFNGAGQSVCAKFPSGIGLGVRRTVLHQALVDAADRAGVDLRWNTPIANLNETDAKWIIGADGSGSRVRRWAGLDEPVRNSRRFAFRQHYAIEPWTRYMEIYFGDRCQIYVTPVAPGEVCVALISHAPELRLAEALQRHFPALHERLAGAPVASRERGAITAAMRLKRVTNGNMALVGDASGSVDAITGQGMCLSFKQAALLADCMAAGDLRPYEHSHPRLAIRPHLMSRAMLLLDRGAIIRNIGLRVMAFQPRIFQTLLKVHVA